MQNKTPTQETNNRMTQENSQEEIVLQEVYKKGFYFGPKNNEFLISLTSTNVFVFMVNIKDKTIILNDDLADDNVDLFIEILEEMQKYLIMIRQLVYKQTSNIIDFETRISQDARFEIEGCITQQVRNSINNFLRKNSKAKELEIKNERLDMVKRIIKEFDGAYFYYSKEDSSKYSQELYKYFLFLLEKIKLLFINIESSLENEIKAHKNICKLYGIEI